MTKQLEEVRDLTAFEEGLSHQFFADTVHPSKMISVALQRWRVVGECKSDTAFAPGIHAFLVTTIWLYKMLYDAANTVYELYNYCLLSARNLRTLTEIILYGQRNFSKLLLKKEFHYCSLFSNFCL